MLGLYEYCNEPPSPGFSRGSGGRRRQLPIPGGAGLSAQAAETVRIRLRALLDLFDDDDIIAGIRLLDEGSQATLEACLRAARVTIPAGFLAMDTEDRKAAIRDRFYRNLRGTTCAPEHCLNPVACLAPACYGRQLDTLRHTSMAAHDGYAEHSHEVRPDHLGVKREGP